MSKLWKTDKALYVQHSFNQAFKTDQRRNVAENNKRNSGTYPQTGLNNFKPHLFSILCYFQPPANNSFQWMISSISLQVRWMASPANLSHEWSSKVWQLSHRLSLFPTDWQPWSGLSAKRRFCTFDDCRFTALWKPLLNYLPQKFSLSGPPSRSRLVWVCELWASANFGNDPCPRTLPLSAHVCPRMRIGLN